MDSPFFAILLDVPGNLSRCPMGWKFERDYGQNRSWSRGMLSQFTARASWASRLRSCFKLIIVYLDYINDAGFMLSAAAGAENIFPFGTCGRVSYDVLAKYISIFRDTLVSCIGYLLACTLRGSEEHWKSLGK